MKTCISIKRGIISLALAIAAAGICFGNPTTYSGSLSVADGGLTAHGEWNNPCTTLSWTVDDSTTPGKWHYSYTLTVPVKDISHMIIEASYGDNPFTRSNLFSPSSSISGWIDSIEIQNYGPGGSTPYMPEDMWGIKFDAAIDATYVTVCFDSDRMPVWGDFYSKDGFSMCNDEWSALYNTGFTIGDYDPVAAAANGSLQNHLLVPDTIPAPGAILLVCIGTTLTGALRRRGMI
ncbi:MAG: hypothetical protein JW787_04510 [Sedimentisphaerales bacterium]|nr:hypothetical protein [Sedimentisphaerales bacterium]